MRYASITTICDGLIFNIVPKATSRNVSHIWQIQQYMQAIQPIDQETLLLCCQCLKSDSIVIQKIQHVYFHKKTFDDSVFRRNYADYLLGEAKDQLSFYYSSEDYEMFLKFFEYLNGQNKFTYEEYISAYTAHSKYMTDVGVICPRFMESPEKYLQFLYELNVICYIERTENNEPFIHWSFKERTYSNISPKVKTEAEYEIFYGMSKSLNTGKKFK